MQEVQETQAWSLGREDPLEIETHSTIIDEKFHGQRHLVGYNPWDHRVGHDWVTEYTHTHLAEFPLSICKESFPQLKIFWLTKKNQ